jgi:hypothetical protein
VRSRGSETQFNICVSVCVSEAGAAAGPAAASTAGAVDVDVNEASDFDVNEAIDVDVSEATAGKVDVDVTLNVAEAEDAAHGSPMSTFRRLLRANSAGRVRARCLLHNRRHRACNLVWRYVDA